MILKVSNSSLLPGRFLICSVFSSNLVIKGTNAIFLDSVSVSKRMIIWFLFLVFSLTVIDLVNIPRKHILSLLLTEVASQ